MEEVPSESLDCSSFIACHKKCGRSDVEALNVMKLTVLNFVRKLCDGLGENKTFEKLGR